MTGPCVLSVDLTGEEAPPSGWLAVLDDAERQRADRFQRLPDRLTFVAAHALKRLVLAAELPGERPEDLDFSANAFGKPALTGTGRPHFNLSHTAGLVALAVWRHGPVGVDVENIRRDIADEDLARATFTAAEVAGLEAEADWTRAFFALWTAKEAVIKAEGQGLSLPLDSVTVSQAEAMGPSGPWRLWRAEPRPGTLLALAWAGGEGDAIAALVLAAAELTAWASGRRPDGLAESLGR